jgi:hypothetical protein
MNILVNHFSSSFCANEMPFQASRTMTLKDLKNDAEIMYFWSLRTCISPQLTTNRHSVILHHSCIPSIYSYTLMLRLNPLDDEAFMNKLWFQKWVCDWFGWGSDMLRLRRVLDKYAIKGVNTQHPLLVGGLPFIVSLKLFSISVSRAARDGRVSLQQLYATDAPSGLKPFMLLAFPVTPLDVHLSAQHHAWDEQRKALKAAGPSWPPPPSIQSFKNAAVIRLGCLPLDTICLRVRDPVSQVRIE